MTLEAPCRQDAASTDVNPVPSGRRVMGANKALRWTSIAADYWWPEHRRVRGPGTSQRVNKLVPARRDVASLWGGGRARMKSLLAGDLGALDAHDSVIQAARLE